MSQLGLDVLAAIGVVPIVPAVTMRRARVIVGDMVGETIEHMAVCIRHTEFDAELIRTVEKDGIEIREGDGLRALQRTSDGFELETASGQRVTVRLMRTASRGTTGTSHAA